MLLCRQGVPWFVKSLGFAWPISEIRFQKPLPDGRGSDRSHEERSPSESEDVLQSQLDNARVDAGGSDLSEAARGEIRKSVDGALAVVRVGELRVVEGVKEFGSELDRVPLADAGGLQNGKIEIELAGAEDDARSAVAVQRAAGGSGISRGALRLAGNPRHRIVNRPSR